MEDQIHGPDGDRGSTPQRRTDREGDRVPNREQSDVRHPHAVASQTRAQANREELPRELREAAQDVALASIRADVLGSSDLLAEEAEELAHQLAVLRPVRDRQLTNPDQEEEREHREHEDRKTDTPILAEQQTQDPGDEDPVAQDLYREPGEEVRQRGHVAVDPFDQLSRRVLLVKGGIEGERVPEEIETKRVRRRPGDRLSNVGRRDHQSLTEHRDPEEEERVEDQHRAGSALVRRVEKGPQDLWIGQAKADRREDQNG